MHVYDKLFLSSSISAGHAWIPCSSGSPVNFIFSLTILFLFLGHFRICFWVFWVSFFTSACFREFPHHAAGNVVGRRSVGASETRVTLRLLTSALTLIFLPHAVLGKETPTSVWAEWGRFAPQVECYQLHLAGKVCREADPSLPGRLGGGQLACWQPVHPAHDFPPRLRRLANHTGNQASPFILLTSQVVICQVGLMMPRVVRKLRQITEVKVWQFSSSTSVPPSFSSHFHAQKRNHQSEKPKQSCFKFCHNHLCIQFTHLCLPHFPHL